MTYSTQRKTLHSFILFFVLRSQTFALNKGISNDTNRVKKKYEKYARIEHKDFVYKVHITQ